MFEVEKASNFLSLGVETVFHVPENPFRSRDFYRDNDRLQKMYVQDEAEGL